MPRVSDAYLLAEHMHDTFSGVSDVLTAEEIACSGVLKRIGSTSSRRVQRIETRGELHGKGVTQTLAKDGLGTFHLSTTYIACNGAHVQADIRPESPPEVLEIVLDTLFMRKLLDIARKRTK